MEWEFGLRSRFYRNRYPALLLRSILRIIFKVRGTWHALPDTIPGRHWNQPRTYIRYLPVLLERSSEYRSWRAVGDESSLFEAKASNQRPCNGGRTQRKHEYSLNSEYDTEGLAPKRRLVVFCVLRPRTRILTEIYGH